MTKIRTYIDANVLINAWRAENPLSNIALVVLEDPERLILSSDFLQLETLPKTIVHKNQKETAFILGVLETAIHIPTNSTITAKALELASRYDIAALDALHAAAAIIGGADELLTFEKPNKPLHRIISSELSVISLHPDHFKIH